MSDDAKNILSVEQYAQKLACDMCEEIVKFKNHFEAKCGEGAGLVLVGMFIQELIFRTVLETLEKHDSGSRKARYDKTVADFNYLKVLIQDAVGYGYSDATLAFTGKNLDYLCTIKPIPDPMSKLLN